MVRTAPLFRLDPGWLFTIAGLVVMVASALLPAERDLHELRQQLAAIELRENYNTQRLQAYDRFMKDLSAHDPALLRRLAASQLNLMPQGTEPLLMATSMEHTVSDWIEVTVPQEEFIAAPGADTLLTRMADGPRRLWLMGGGALVVFLGLVMGFSVSPRPMLPQFDQLDMNAWREAVQADQAAMNAAKLQALEQEQRVASQAQALAEQAELAAANADELAAETGDVESAFSTAEAIEHEVFKWPEAVPPFEAAPSESAESVQPAQHLSIASAWEESDVEASDWHDANTAHDAHAESSTASPSEKDSQDDRQRLRSHGSD